MEEKVDIADLILPSKPMKVEEIEINDLKQEPLEEENQHAASESDPDLGNNFKVKMEENILKLCEEFVSISKIPPFFCKYALNI